MRFLKKLFGLRVEEPVVPPAGPPAAGPRADSSKDPNMIRAYDGYGRELFITREAWRKDVLPGAIRKAWDDPEHLYRVIVTSLEDGLAKDMLEPAERLSSIDPTPSRGATILGIVHLEMNRLDDAERVLTEHLRKHGEDGVVLTNLAKVHSKLRRHALGRDALARPGGRPEPGERARLVPGDPRGGRRGDRPPRGAPQGRLPAGELARAALARSLGPRGRRPPERAWPLRREPLESRPARAGGPAP